MDPPIPERSIAPSPFRIDEGYSEDPSGSEVMMDDTVESLESVNPVASQHLAARDWLLSQPEDFRSRKYDMSWS